MRIWAKYLEVLNKRPLAIQVVQTSVLMGVGDVISQQFIEKVEAHDHARTLRFMGIGCVFMAPVLRGWYLTLDKIFKPNPAVSAMNLGLRKMATDQLLFAPVCNFCFISILGGMQRKNLEQIKLKVSKEWPDVMKTNYKLWPAIQVFNFWLVPLNLRPLIVSIVAIFWNSYLSWKSNSDRPQ